MIKQCTKALAMRYNNTLVTINALIREIGLEWI